MRQPKTKPRRPMMSSALRRKRQAHVFERDGHKCLRCGAAGDLTLDHVVPLAAGGTNANSNLQTLCGSCNQRKGDTSFSYLDPEW